MSFQITKATVTHIELIQSLQKDSNLQVWSKKNLVRMIEDDKNYNCFVVLNDSTSSKNFGFELIAYIIFNIIVDEAELLSIAVNPNFRQQGIAGNLLEQSISKLKTTCFVENSLKQIFLEVSSINLPAQKFYQKFGFTKIGERKKYYADGNDAWIYRN